MPSIHQYEIKFLPILNFVNEVRPIASKFVDFFNNVKVNNENTAKEQIILTSSVDNFEVGFVWDTLFIRTEGEIESFLKKNSIVESVFFRIFKELEKTPSFTGVQYHFFYSVNFQTEFEDENTMSSSFIKSFFYDSLSKNLNPPFNNLSLSTNKYENDQGLENFLISTFLDIEDLRSKGFLIKSPQLLLSLADKKGIYFEHKLIRRLNEVSFSEYKKLGSEALKNINQIWER